MAEENKMTTQEPAQESAVPTETKSSETEKPSDIKLNIGNKDSVDNINTGSTYGDNANVNIDNRDVHTNTYNVADGGNVTVKEAMSADAIRAKGEENRKTFDHIVDKGKEIASSAYSKTLPGMINNAGNKLKGIWDAEVERTKTEEAAIAAERAAKQTKRVGSLDMKRFSNPGLNVPEVKTESIEDVLGKE